MYDIICRFISFLGKISWGASFPVHPRPSVSALHPRPPIPPSPFPLFSALHHRSPKFRFGARPLPGPWCPARPFPALRAPFVPADCHSDPPKPPRKKNF